MTALTLASSSVLHARTPSRRYTANAMDKRLNPNLWCTGEDSNLRSSGERQIYSLLPLTTRPPVRITGFARTRNPFQGCNLQASQPFVAPVQMRNKQKRVRIRVNILPHEGSLHVGRIPLRSAFLVILLRCRRQPVAQLPCDSGNVTWSWRRDSNPRPSDYKSDALPAELRQRTQTPSPRGAQSPPDPFLMSGTII